MPVNQSLLLKDKRYPERTVLDDAQTSWDIETPGYNPPLYPDFEAIIERLAEQGVEVPDVQTLVHLAKLTTRQAAEIVGDSIADVRHPLGRTGINGTGIYYKAGKSQAADLAVLRDEPYGGLEIALVYNRGKWHLPGGFLDPADQGDHKQAAIREGLEEINIDLNPIAEEVETLIPEHVKPGSSRSVDLGYITTQVETIVLPQFEMSEDLKAGDDAELAEWVDGGTVLIMGHDGRMSKDHHQFALNAFRLAEKQKEAKAQL